jgi:hypothetical protein
VAFLKKHTGKIVAAAAVLAVLAAAWVWGGAYARPVQPAETVAVQTETAAPSPQAAASGEQEQPSESPEASASPAPGVRPTPTASPAPSAKAAPAEAPDASPKSLDASPAQLPSASSSEPDKAPTCTVTVRCDTVLNNMGRLNKEKVELVPKDGVIFLQTAITFNEGENVFNALQREMKRAKIHMAFRATPLYNSAYIEAIHNLYEFDCGELSGWMYKVNGQFPAYGCSRYLLKDGDEIEWLYTCDLGRDIGGEDAARAQRDE